MLSADNLSNSLDPDQARDIGPDLDPTRCPDGNEKI